MQEYKCTVKGTDGKVLNNYKLKAEGPTDLMRQLKGQGLYLIHFEEVEVSQDVVGGNKIRLKIKDIAVVCRQLASMLSAGVTLVKALNILYLQTDKKNIRETVKKLYESVQKGEMFSEAL
jgi:type IV pilus assembly protein PilC